MEMGIKPVYVFDGAPPEMKSGELKKRSDTKAAATAAAKAAAAKATEEGSVETAEKYTRRVNSVTPAMTADCKVLLRAMGVPVVEAPCEAEAQCAAMAKAGIVYAMASEDTDSLTFGTPLLIRQKWAGARAGANKEGVKHMTFSLDVVGLGGGQEERRRGDCRQGQSGGDQEGLRVRRRQHAIMVAMRPTVALVSASPSVGCPACACVCRVWCGCARRFRRR